MSDLQMVLVASTIQVTALTTGDIDFSGAQSQVMAGAARGLVAASPDSILREPYFEEALLAAGFATRICWAIILPSLSV